MLGGKGGRLVPLPVVVAAIVRPVCASTRTMAERAVGNLAPRPKAGSAVTSRAALLARSSLPDLVRCRGGPA